MQSQKKNVVSLNRVHNSLVWNRVLCLAGFAALLTLIIVVWASEISRISRNNAEATVAAALLLPTPAPPTASPTPASASGNVQVQSDGTRFQIAGKKDGEPSVLFSASAVSQNAPLADFVTREEVSVLIAGESGNNSLWSLEALIVNGQVVAHTASLGGSAQDIEPPDSSTSKRATSSSSPVPLASRRGLTASQIHSQLAAASQKAGVAAALVPSCDVYDVQRGKQGRISFLGSPPERFVGFSTNLPDAPFDFNDDVKIRGALQLCGDLAVGGALRVSDSAVLDERVVRTCNASTAQLCPTLNACQTPRCLEAVGSGALMCLSQPRAPGASCDDGDARTVNDVCVAGGVCRGKVAAPQVALCTPLEEQECEEAPDCHFLSLCVRADGDSTCFFKPSTDSFGEPCDDNNVFTVQDTCNALGQCKGTPLKVYAECTPSEAAQCPTPLLDGCADVSCAKLGSDTRCLLEARQDGIACDDRNEFTEQDVCTGGVCVGVPAFNAPQAKECTAQEEADNCGVAAACRSIDCTRRGDGTFHCSDSADATKNGASCDDGNALTAQDVCDNGVCRGTAVQVSRLCTAPETLAQCGAPPACRKTTCSLLADSQYKCADLANRTANGEPCSTQNPAVHNERCFDGQCIGDSVEPTSPPPTPQTTSPTPQPSVPALPPQEGDACFVNNGGNIASGFVNLWADFELCSQNQPFGSERVGPVEGGNFVAVDCVANDDAATAAVGDDDFSLRLVAAEDAFYYVNLLETQRVCFDGTSDLVLRVRARNNEPSATRFDISVQELTPNGEFIDQNSVLEFDLVQLNIGVTADYEDFVVSVPASHLQDLVSPFNNGVPDFRIDALVFLSRDVFVDVSIQSVVIQSGCFCDKPNLVVVDDALCTSESQTDIDMWQNFEQCSQDLPFELPGPADGNDFGEFHGGFVDLSCVPSAGNLGQFSLNMAARFTETFYYVNLDADKRVCFDRTQDLRIEMIAVNHGDEVADLSLSVEELGNDGQIGGDILRYGLPSVQLQVSPAIETYNFVIPVFEFTSAQSSFEPSYRVDALVFLTGPQLLNITIEAVTISGCLCEAPYTQQVFGNNAVSGGGNAFNYTVHYPQVYSHFGLNYRFLQQKQTYAAMYAPQ